MIRSKRQRAFEATQPLHDQPDAALVHATQVGGVEAFSELVRRHEHAVYNLCYRFMRDATSAEDMAQEAFLKAFRLIRGFRGDSAFSTWLYRVTCSVCLSEIERRKRRGERDHAAQLEPAPAPRPLPHDVSPLLRGCIDRLPAHYADAVRLYYLDELPYEDIAARLGTPIGTLKTWMYRARTQLREMLEDELQVTRYEQLA